jgi:hypothetical protein
MSILHMLLQLDQNLMAKFKTTPQYTAACAEHVNQVSSNSRSNHLTFSKSTSISVSRVGSVFSIL